MTALPPHDDDHVVWIVLVRANGGGLETKVQRSPNFFGCYCIPMARSKSTYPCILASTRTDGFSPSVVTGMSRSVAALPIARPCRTCTCHPAPQVAPTGRETMGVTATFRWKIVNQDRPQVGEDCFRRWRKAGNTECSCVYVMVLSQNVGQTATVRHRVSSFCRIWQGTVTDAVPQFKQWSGTQSRALGDGFFFDLITNRPAAGNDFRRPGTRPPDGGDTRSGLSWGCAPATTS